MFDVAGNTLSDRAGIDSVAYRIQNKAKQQQCTLIRHVV
jgi:hypothetical protein